MELIIRVPDDIDHCYIDDPFSLELLHGIPTYGRIVRCRDCLHYVSGACGLRKGVGYFLTSPDDFCSRGIIVGGAS